MANLRANKITSTEVFDTTGSVQFDGSGDYLSLADSNDWNYSTGDFTVEFWYYFNSLPDSDGQFFYSQRVDGGNYNFIYATNTKWEFDSYESNSQGPKLTFTTTHNLSTWNHLAVTRSGNIFRLFVNGVESATQTSSDNLPDLSAVLEIGRWTGGPSRYVNGHISNLRILKGTALYTKNFTPPTRELTVIPNTILLACQSTTRANEEKTGKTITVNGNAVANELTPGLLTDVVKSGGTSAITGSVEFDGTGDYLDIGNSSDFSLSGQRFTIDFWVYPTAYSQGGGGTESRTIVGKWDGPGSAQGWRIDITTSSIIWYTTSNIHTTPITLNQWTHIAVVGDGSNTSFYKNGVLVSGPTANTWTEPSTGKSLLVGALMYSPYLYYYQGFISNLRIIKGTTLYTGNFIPPTRELKRLPNTVLLCCKNSSDPAAEETGKTITANGDPAASNFTPPVGFDGTVTFDGVTKINTPNYFYLPTGNTEDRGRGLGVFGGGYSVINTIEYINIQSSGNSLDFGDLSQARRFFASCSSINRGIFAGGASPAPTNVNTIDYITISKNSNAIDFGDLTSARNAIAGCSSNTRGVFAGGDLNNTIDYITISSIGNAIDFGDLTQARYGISGCSSPTRGIFGGGIAPTVVNTIDYLTISSTGNASDFGDLTQSRNGIGACSSNIRGIFGGGDTPSIINTIDYVTISTTGNAQDFGDLTLSASSVGSCSNSIRGVFIGGVIPSSVNTIQFVTIASTGNSSDFGDMLEVKSGISGLSDSHGGLG